MRFLDIKLQPEDIDKLKYKNNKNTEDLVLIIYYIFKQDLVLCKGDLDIYLQRVRGKSEDKLILYSILLKLQ